MLKVLFQHLTQNSNSKPLDFMPDIRTVTYTTKCNNKERKIRKKFQMPVCCTFIMQENVISSVKQALLSVKECLLEVKEQL